MTDLRPTLSDPASGAHRTPPGVRPLTADELGHLDRARAHLRASGADLTDVHAVGALLHATRTRWAAEPGAPVPQAMVMALGVGVGDLVVALVPGSRWALRTAGAAPTPAVMSRSGEDAALPLADVAARWHSGCTPAWVAEYVSAAAAHLASSAGPDVPTPRVPARTAPEPPADVLPTRAESTLPSRAESALPTRADTALPLRTEAALPSRAASALPSRASVETDPAAVDAAPLPSRPTADAGPAGYFATAAGAFPTPHVTAPAPGPLSSGPSRPVHTSLASAFSRPPAAAAPPQPPAPAPAPGPAPAPAYRIPADLPHPPSRAAQDIALGVLDQALAIAIASGGAAAPFAVVDGSPTQSHEPRQFEGHPARAQQEARAWVRSTGATRAAVAWFGQLSAEEGAAVFVEASDAGAPSLVVAHRYSAVSYDEGRTRPARPVGDPLVLGQDVPLL